MQLAILMHVPGLCPPEAERQLALMVDESVLYGMAGALTRDVVLALLVLSMAPLPFSADLHMPVAPIRLISLAYEYSRSLGLGGGGYIEKLQQDGETVIAVRTWEDKDMFLKEDNTYLLSESRRIGGELINVGRLC